MKRNFAAEYKTFVELYGAAIRREWNDENALNDPIVEAIITSIPEEFDVYYEMYQEELAARVTRASLR